MSKSRRARSHHGSTRAVARAAAASRTGPSSQWTCSSTCRAARAASSGGHANLSRRNASEAAEASRQSGFSALVVPFRLRTGTSAHVSKSQGHESVSIALIRCSAAFAAAAPGDAKNRLVVRSAGDGRKKKSRPNSARQSWPAHRVLQPAERRTRRVKRRHSPPNSLNRSRVGEAELLAKAHAPQLF